MRLRSRRQNLVVWSSSVSQADRRGVPRVTRPVRTGRVRRWIRTGALLAIIGLMYLARAVRTRWRLTLSLAGVVATVAGVVLPSGVIITAGLVVFLVVFIDAQTGESIEGIAGGVRQRWVVCAARW
jgi:hypothetical protein